MQNCIVLSHGSCKLLFYHVFFYTHNRCSENDITDAIDETFTITEERLGEVVAIELKPGGGDIAVTEDNKKDYVDAVVAYRLSKYIKDQFEAIVSGFDELIPQNLITVFDERELDFLISGMSEIDV